MAKPNTLFKGAYNACLRNLERLGVGERLPSEAELAVSLAVSRTTVRSIVSAMQVAELVDRRGRARTVRRPPGPHDFFPEEETDPIAAVVERHFMQRILGGGAEPGDQINELEFAREIGVGTSAVREFLIRFSRFGLIEKRPNASWILKGFTREFALELSEVRELFELRSARALATLPAGHPAWPELDALAEEHRELLGDIGVRYREFSELDERFHRFIHGASLNRFIVDFYDVIAMVFHYHFQWNKADEFQRNRVAVAEHLDYIDALRRQDLDAVEYYCRRHLKSARETLLASIGR